GGLSMLWGYVQSALKGEKRLSETDPDLVAYIRRYQRQALIKGKARAIADLDADGAARFAARARA
ncbi:MAG: glycosyl transferase family 2, partial [Pseudomonadota bacterium]